MTDEKITKDLKLFERVDEVLFYMWDPLGMSYEPACRDEYSSYVEKICQMLIDGRSEQDLAQHLDWLCTNQMGTETTKQHCLKTAEYLAYCRTWILQGE